jgi:adenine deaminase
MNQSNIIQGRIVDIPNKRIFNGEIRIYNGRIASIVEKEHEIDQYILPGFIDAHIHIESSMLVPSEFARIAVTHGTVATVSDPHEIANVLGTEGIDFMIENSEKVPFKFYFGAPSCVPATRFESSGATIDSNKIKELLSRKEINYLAEMMNYPGVIQHDEEVHRKIEWAKHFQKPIDGHAPGLIGDDLTKYISSGISTDHECFSYDEALEKLQKGMKILIREGSAAKNFNALIDLLPDHYENIMFCSDDKHPDDLLLGHIDKLCSRALSKGMDLFKVLQVACINPVKHYDLDVGTLKVGDAADFIIVEDLTDFKVHGTYIQGEQVFDGQSSLIKSISFPVLNNFNTSKKTTSDFILKDNAHEIRVIEALDGELVTREIICNSKQVNGKLVSNTDDDILKLAVINRYQDQTPALAFIKNFGLKEGAIASSIGHDSHNIIAVGVSDEDLCKAVNLIIENRGGICAITSEEQKVLPMPVAGIMSDRDANTVGLEYSELDRMSKRMGSTLTAPFMTLSFMALLVIPSLKLSDKGLFDGNKFEFTSLKVN